MIKCIHISFITYGNFSFGIIAFSNFFTGKKITKKKSQDFQVWKLFFSYNYKTENAKKFLNKGKAELKK